MTKLNNFHFVWFLLLLVTTSNPQEANKNYFIQNYSRALLPHSLTQTVGFNLLHGLNKTAYIQKLTSSSTSVMIDSIIYGTPPDSKGKVTFEYNQNGQIHSFTIFFRTNNLWENSLRVIYTYDSSGNVIQTLHESWSNSNWESFIKESFTYDDNGKLVLHLIQFKNEGMWVDDLKISNEYDSQDNLWISTSQRWVDSAWVNSSKSMREYNPNGLMAFGTLKIWDGNDWQNYWLSIFEYDDNWQLTTVLANLWEGNSWNNYIRILFTYSQFQPQTTGVIELLQNKQWNTSERYMYSYNNENYFLNGIYEYWINDNWEPGVGVINVYNPDGFDMHFLTHRVEVHYAQTTYVNEEDKIHPQGYMLLQNFPNPFNPATTISFSIAESEFVTLKVYDVLGKEIELLVNEEKPAGNYKIQFDANSLPSGIYFYSISAGGFHQTKKMILVR